MCAKFEYKYDANKIYNTVVLNPREKSQKEAKLIQRTLAKC